MRSVISASLRAGVLTSLILALSGCSVTETVNKILSSTTPGDWYSEDGMPKAEYRLNVFVALNLDNLKADLATGARGSIWRRSPSSCRCPRDATPSSLRSRNRDTRRWPERTVRA